MAASNPPDHVLACDVLVIGGGLAGTWAALGAARAGAQVVLADKGWCGTSGVTASAGPAHWYVAPDLELRAEAIRRRAAAGEGLADPRWMARVLDATWQHLPTLASHYAFPVNDAGQTVYRALRGPEYLGAMRRLVVEAGVTILDQSPVLELLQHDDGAVAGAAGWQRQVRRGYQVRAGAVVLASGGCAFGSRLLGAGTNTGDGLLMAAELGADLSGMEFTNYYTVAPAWSSMTRSMSYAFARYFDSAGRELPIPPGPAATEALGRALLAGPVYCTLDRMPHDIRARLTRISPNVMLPFVRRGIDPFADRFEIALRGEGTVRGIGGLRIANADCETTVSGLYAAGDAATRELVAGAISGGGAQNSAWGLASGLWAGRAAAERVRRLGRRNLQPARAAGAAGLRPRRADRTLDRDRVLADIQRPMLAIDHNMFRSGAVLERSLARLDDHWQAQRDHARGQGDDLQRSREAAAMLACARWSLTASIARRESRGMHRRLDAPELDPAQAHRIVLQGIDRPAVRHEAVDQPEKAAA